MREGWEEVRLGDLFEPSKHVLGDHEEEPTVFSVSKHDGVVRSEDYFDRRVASSKLDKYKVLDPGMWVYSTIHIDEGSIARNNHDVSGVLSPMYTVMRWKSDQHLPELLEHILRSDAMLAIYADSAQGSINRRRSLSWKAFSGISVVLPPLPEQRRIVDLIGAVDDAIEAADAEAGAADGLITSAVDAEIARIKGPTVSLGSAMTIVRGGSPRPIADYETDSGDGIPWIKIGDVSPDGKYITKTSKKILRSGISRSRVVQPGDFILSNSMSFGRPYISQIEGCIHDGWLSLSEFEESFDRDYLYFFLRSSTIQQEFEKVAAGSGVRNLKKESVSQIQVTIPALKTQKSIVALANAATEARTAARATADALRGLRSNLLTALLSGDHEIPETYDRLLEGAQQ